MAVKPRNSLLYIIKTVKQKKESLDSFEEEKLKVHTTRRCRICVTISRTNGNVTSFDKNETKFT